MAFSIHLKKFWKFWKSKKIFLKILIFFNFKNSKKYLKKEKIKKFNKFWKFFRNFKKSFKKVTNQYDNVGLGEKKCYIPLWFVTKLKLTLTDHLPVAWCPIACSRRGRAKQRWHGSPHGTPDESNGACGNSRIYCCRYFSTTSLDLETQNKKKLKNS